MKRKETKMMSDMMSVSFALFPSNAITRNNIDDVLCCSKKPPAAEKRHLTTKKCLHTWQIRVCSVSMRRETYARRVTEDGE